MQTAVLPPDGKRAGPVKLIADGGVVEVAQRPDWHERQHEHAAHDREGETEDGPRLGPSRACAGGDQRHEHERHELRQGGQGEHGAAPGRARECEQRQHEQSRYQRVIGVLLKHECAERKADPRVTERESERPTLRVRAHPASQQDQADQRYKVEDDARDLGGGMRCGQARAADPGLIVVKERRKRHIGQVVDGSVGVSADDVRPSPPL